MNEILDIILKDTFTKNSLQHRLRILKSYLIKAFFGMQKMSSFDQKDLIWLASLPKDLYKSFNKDNVYKIFDELDSIPNSLPTLTMYLPIEATDNVCLLVGSYARKTFTNSQIILDTKYDPVLIAGCALVWKGVYRDYSLRAKIESKKEEILGNFKQFLR